MLGGGAPRVLVHGQQDTAFAALESRQWIVGVHHIEHGEDLEFARGFEELLDSILRRLTTGAVVIEDRCRCAPFGELD